ncbi:MAG TPA: prepilin-type N-terminal cleavage/methylation domain-containing protein [Anaeromyxobacter sp.]
MARRRARGFTLLEVMVALAVLAGALLLVSEVVGGALRNHVRARQLGVATLLARGKMVALQAQYERKGFRDFDESDEGTFEDEGHREIRWKVDVRRPTLELGPEAVLASLTGGKKLEELLPSPKEAPQLAPFQAILTATLQAQLTKISEQLKKCAREVRLTVSWQDGAVPESFDVVTDLVVTEPEER